jgi:hypothetical protein
MKGEVYTIFIRYIEICAWREVDNYSVVYSVVLYVYEKPEKRRNLAGII